jgi:hypothetical protein
MVTSLPADRRGASSLGCLITLLVFVAALYYAVHLGEVYLRYYQLVDEMQVNARLAPSLTDEVIQRRLATKVGEIFGPDRHMQFKIGRGGRTRVFSVETEYRDSVSLPFFKHTFVLKPRAEEPI